MNYKKTYVILKVVLIISMILLIAFIMHFRTNDCSYCEFDMDGKNVKIGKFMEIYQEECLQVEDHIELTKSFQEIPI